MPVKSQQRIPTDTVRLRGRTNTGTTVASKRSTRETAQPRVTSGESEISSTDTSVIIETNPRYMKPVVPFPRITEVDDTNIDEVLSLSDFSLIPASFLTEIQQDQVYETILGEIQKKIPHAIRSHPLRLPRENDEDENKSELLSPHLLAIHDDDDDTSVTDEVSSSSSPEDDGPLSQVDYDTDIESEPVVHREHDATGRTEYRELCQRKKLVPCSYFLAHIQDTEMILRYHQFNTDDVQAITKTLATNLGIERLFLDGNYIQEQAAKHLCKLILTNDSITELSLADNRLGGGEGTKDICKMLTLHRNLKKINLSGNKFNELDVVQLVEAFEQNKVLQELDLSHNGFGEQCGKVLGAFISTNDSLEAINLSWNNFRGRSAIDMINGIKANVYLRRCNLEMNGFGPEGGQALADCIKQNSTLEELNINANRLNTPNAFAIAQALLTNDALEVLKMADNQINCDGVLAVFLCLKANQANTLRVVDFSHTVVTQETVDVCKDLVQLKDGKFQYLLGKMTPEKLQPNSISECYTKTNEELLNRFRASAAHVKPTTN